MSSSSVVIRPTAQHTASVIFMHGLGDSGHGWAPVMRMLARTLPFIKFILPHAPSQPVTLNGGMRMPSWYDILSLAEQEGREDEKGLTASKDIVLKLVEAEHAEGIPHDRIVIGGFSQGAALSLFTGLSAPHPLAAIIALSGYLPIRSKFLSTTSSLLAHPRTPIFMGHGTADQVVRHQWGSHSAEALRSAGCSSLTFKSYENLDHSCSDREIEDVRCFLQAILLDSDHNRVDL